MKCLGEATAKGLPALPDGEMDAVKRIDRYYREHEFRYIVSGIKDYPPLELVIAAGATILGDSARSIATVEERPELVRRMTRESIALRELGEGFRVLSKGRTGHAEE